MGEGAEGERRRRNQPRRAGWPTRQRRRLTNGAVGSHPAGLAVASVFDKESVVTAWLGSARLLHVSAVLAVILRCGAVVFFTESQQFGRLLSLSRISLTRFHYIQNKERPSDTVRH